MQSQHKTEANVITFMITAGSPVYLGSSRSAGHFTTPSSSISAGAAIFFLCPTLLLQPLPVCFYTGEIKNMFFFL